MYYISKSQKGKVAKLNLIEMKNVYASKYAKK